MEKKRVIYLDLLRIIAMFGVILIHVTSIKTLESSINTTYLVSTAINSLVRWSVPIFFMISGAMFLRKEKEYTFAIMLKKYIPRMLLCLIFWGCIYSVLDIYVFGSFSIKSIILIPWQIVANATGYHLWYLYALIAIYLMIPVYKIIANNLSQKQLVFVLLVWMVLSLAATQFNAITSALNISLSLDWYWPMIVNWGGYILLGHYLYTYDLKKKYNSLLIVFGLLVLIVGAVGNTVITQLTNNNFEALSLPEGLTTCFSAIAVFLLFKGLFNKDYSNSVRRIISNVGNNTFGIYLIHVLLNTVVFRIIGLPLNFYNPVISIIVYAIAIFVVSYIIVVIIKRIPIIKKLVS